MTTLTTNIKNSNVSAQQEIQISGSAVSSVGIDKNNLTAQQELQYTDYCLADKNANLELDATLPFYEQFRYLLDSEQRDLAFALKRATFKVVRTPAPVTPVKPMSVLEYAKANLISMLTIKNKSPARCLLCLSPDEMKYATKRKNGSIQLGFAL
jgi:hypothetical protein